jgi:hypothetical protein
MTHPVLVLNLRPEDPSRRPWDGHLYRGEILIEWNRFYMRPAGKRTLGRLTISGLTANKTHTVDTLKANSLISAMSKTDLFNLPNNPEERPLSTISLLLATFTQTTKKTPRRNLIYPLLLS